MNSWPLARRSRACTSALTIRPKRSASTDASCECRKPAPGMLLAAARDLGIDLQSSAMFGDKDSDLEAARAAGVPIRVLLGTDARELPDMPPASGLASAVFRGLLEATADAALLVPPSTAGSAVR